MNLDFKKDILDMSAMRPITVAGISSHPDDNTNEDVNIHGWRNKRSQTHIGTGTILHARQRVNISEMLS